MARRNAVVAGALGILVIAVGVGVLVAGQSTPSSEPGAGGRPGGATRTDPGAGVALEIAVEDAAGPWSLADGTGYANDVVRAAFHAAGVDVHFEVVPYARCKQMVIAGEIAACFSMSKRPELDASIVFSAQPLFVCQVELVQSAAAASKVASEADLHPGTVVGTTLGYEYPDAIYRLRAAGTIVVEEALSEELNLKKLADGRIDAAIMIDNDIKKLASMEARAGVAGKIAPGYRIGEMGTFIGFSRKHPRGLEARDRFEAGLRAIAADGTLRAIEARWTRRAATGAP